MVVKEPFVDVPAFGITSRTTDAAVTDALSMLNPALEQPEDSRLLSLLANVLEAMVDAAEQREHARLHARLQGHEVGGASPQLTVFHGLRAPPISVEAYLVRIAKYAKCSPACFAHSMVHMLKLAQQDPSFAPTRLNVHRLVLTGVLISAKFLDDRYFNNAFYAKVGGVSTVELNRLELEMLQLLEFRLSVTPEQLVGVLLDAQSGRLVAQMAAAYSSACGMATALDAAVLGVPLELPGVNTTDAAASSNVAGSVLCGAGQAAAGCWEATSPAACGMAAAAAAGAQQVAQLLQQQQQQQLMQQLAAVHRKRRSSMDMLDGSDFRPRAYHRASMEVVAMAQ